MKRSNLMKESWAHMLCVTVGAFAVLLSLAKLAALYFDETREIGEDPAAWWLALILLTVGVISIGVAYIIRAIDNL